MIRYAWRSVTADSIDGISIGVRSGAKLRVYLDGHVVDALRQTTPSCRAGKQATSVGRSRPDSVVRSTADSSVTYR